MPRKPIIRSNEHFYHVTARSNNKENFFLPLKKVWEILVWKLAELQKEHEIKIAGFVLMSNHFHLLILSPAEDIDRIMYFLMKDSTLKIQKCSGRINKIFGGRYKGSIIENHQYLFNVYKYIYRNPVAAGIAEQAENYEFSSLHYAIFKKSLPFELFEILHSPDLNWINQSFNEDESQSIKFGLSRSVFQYKKDKLSRKLIIPA